MYRAPDVSSLQRTLGHSATPRRRFSDLNVLYSSSNNCTTLQAEPAGDQVEL